MFPRSSASLFQHGDRIPEWQGSGHDTCYFYTQDGLILTVRQGRGPAVCSQDNMLTFNVIVQTVLGDIVSRQPTRRLLGQWNQHKIESH